MKSGCITKLELGLLRENSYIITNGDGSAAIIDPGAEIGKILSALDELGAKAESVLITHGHYDHIGCVAALQNRGAKVYISAKDFELLKKTNFLFDLDVPSEPFAADVTVNDGDVFTIGKHEFKVLSTPGHTPGGVCYIMDGNSIFTGDTLFCGGIGRHDFPFGNGRDLMLSLVKLFALDGDFDVYPGHGQATTLCVERETNPYAKF